MLFRRSNKDTVSAALTYLSLGLYPFVQKAVRKNPSLQDSTISEDVYDLLKLIEKNWSIFKTELVNIRKKDIKTILTVRNRWAHFKPSDPIRADKVRESLCLIAKLLDEVKAEQQSQQVRRLLQEFSASKKTKKTSTSSKSSPKKTSTSSKSSPKKTSTSSKSSPKKTNTSSKQSGQRYEGHSQKRWTKVAVKLIGIVVLVALVLSYGPKVVINKEKIRRDYEKIISYIGDKGTHVSSNAKVDSLSKFKEVPPNNNQPSNQEEIIPLQTEVTPSKARENASEWETARPYGTADQDRLTNLTEDASKIIIVDQLWVSANPQQGHEEVRQVRDSVRLMVGTEELLKENGFLKMEYERRSKKIPKKSYKLVGELKSDDPLVRLVPIREEFSLTLQSIPNDKLKLQVLVGSDGKLKKDRDYKISKSKGTTSITFTNDNFLGEDVLAVVEVEN